MKLVYPRPNERCLVTDRGVEYDLAALRIQCCWRKLTARRTVRNQRLRSWFLRKTALVIQQAWRRYHAKLVLAQAQAARLRTLETIDREYEEEKMAQFKESLLWRMAECDEAATAIKAWWKSAHTQRKIGNTIALVVESAGIDLPVTDPDDFGSVLDRSRRGAPPFYSSEAAGSLRRGSGSTVSAAHALRRQSHSVTVGEDAVPRPGILRPPLRPPPPSGTVNTNIRKEDREKKELRLLETAIFIAHTHANDHRHAIAREQEIAEAVSATQIQRLFRQRAARDTLTELVAKRRARYDSINPTKSQLFAARHPMVAA
ncbi:hypothetical protein DIPPA_14292 [Diplonema papillatum]|nr:hypothetical protein DIPPA_14292 [Diplonema papillatum]